MIIKRKIWLIGIEIKYTELARTVRGGEYVRPKVT